MAYFSNATIRASSLAGLVMTMSNLLRYAGVRVGSWPERNHTPIWGIWRAE
jgi:hypothetical protein